MWQAVSTWRKRTWQKQSNQHISATLMTLMLLSLVTSATAHQHKVLLSSSALLSSHPLPPSNAVQLSSDTDSDYTLHKSLRAFFRSCLHPSLFLRALRGLIPSVINRNGYEPSPTNLTRLRATQPWYPQPLCSHPNSPHPNSPHPNSPR